jgi:NDP-sugar pyrophosphorylase family protein
VSSPVRTAFLLCAGWGQRLQPLTNQIPKPLVPIAGIPLCEFALSRLVDLGVERMVINTHRLPEEFRRLFPRYPEPTDYRGVEVLFRHEPELLETAGGLKNIEDLLLPGPVLVHNGDILAELDLPKLCAAHANSGALSTLALRSSGSPRNVGFEEETGTVTDLRGEIGASSPQFLYTGICVVDPRLLQGVEAGRPLSFVPVWLEAIRAGEKIAGVVLDEGLWRDIGNREEYLKIHADLASGAARLSPPATAPEGWPQWVAPGVQVDENADVRDWNWLGPGVVIGAGAVVERSVIWSGGQASPGALVTDSVICEGMIAVGKVEGTAL